MNRTFVPSTLSTGFSDVIETEAAGGGMIFVAGQLGVGPDGPPKDFRDEVRACYANIRKSLENVGATLEDLVRVDVYLTDLELYSQFAEIRKETFPKDPPTSTAVCVARLLLGARIEINGIAVSRKRPSGRGVGS